MIKLKGPVRYATRVNDVFVRFNVLGMYQTENKELAESLLKNDKITEMKAEKEVKKAPAKVGQTAEQIAYKGKFGKDVPVNKKNDIEWIKSKLEE